MRRLSTTRVWLGWTVLAGMFFWLVASARHAREAAEESACLGHFAQIRIALMNYEDSYESLPPATAVCGANQELHSWRLLLMPILADSSVRGSIDLDKPWNDPIHQQLALTSAGGVFECEFRQELLGHTSYVALVGPGTAFGDGQPIDLDTLAEDRGDVILVLEISDRSIGTFEPRDLSHAELAADPVAAYSRWMEGAHEKGIGVLFANERTRRISHDELGDVLDRSYRAVRRAEARAND